VVDEIATADDSATLTLGPAEGIAPTTAGGEPMIITGVLLDVGCQPVAGAELAVWQTDASGLYGPGQETGSLQCCYLQGQVTTDAQGRFMLISVKPGHYQGEAQPPPAHIHVEGHGAAQGLETEIVFAGDPYLPANLNRLVVIDLSLADGVTWRGSAVIVMGAR
jgi:protocatechuate 3,4-dioxygenase beta subunit